MLPLNHVYINLTLKKVKIKNKQITIGNIGNLKFENNDLNRSFDLHILLVLRFYVVDKVIDRFNHLVPPHNLNCYLINVVKELIAIKIMENTATVHEFGRLTNLIEKKTKNNWYLYLFKTLAGIK